MGGKTSKGSVGSTSSSHPPLNRSGSAIANASHSLPAHKASAVEAKLQTLDHIYAGIAACVILSKSGELMSAITLYPHHL